MGYMSIPAVIRNKNRWLLCKVYDDGGIDLYHPKDKQMIDFPTVVEEHSLASFNEVTKAAKEDGEFTICYALDKLEYALIYHVALDRNNYARGKVCEITQQLGSYTEMDTSIGSVLTIFTMKEAMPDKYVSGEYCCNGFYNNRSDISVKGLGAFVYLTGDLFKFRKEGYSSRPSVPTQKEIKDCTESFYHVVEEHKLAKFIKYDDSIGDATSNDSAEDEINTDTELYTELMSMSRRELPIDLLVEFAVTTNPFKSYNKAMFDQMVRSIRTRGVITPITVRPHPKLRGKYEIICGHNRFRACEALGLNSIPAVIEEMDDDTAVLLMIESNFKQRHGLSYSEKAFAYKLVNDIYKKQGKRNDLYGHDDESELRDTHVPKLELRITDIIGGDNNRSGRTVRRYIRLTELNDEFLDDVDSGKLPFRIAEPISYLSKEEQKGLRDLIKFGGSKVTLEQAEALKAAKNDNKRLETDRMIEILEATKPKEPEKRSPIKLSYESIAHFFEGEDLTDEDINNRIIEALTQYYDKQ